MKKALKYAPLNMLYTTFKTRLSFEESTSKTDEIGGIEKNWQAIFNAWGKIIKNKSVSKKYKYLCKQDEEFLIITRNHPLINKDLRIKGNKEIYYIESIDIIDDRANYIELTTKLGA